MPLKHPSLKKMCLNRNHTSPKPVKKSLGGERGFTLLELLVGMTVSLIVSLGVAALVISLIRANALTVRGTRVTQDLRVTSEIISRELRRSGYNQNAIQLISNAPLFGNGFDDIEWGDTHTATTDDCPITQEVGEASSCIVFSYDRQGINDGETSNDPSSQEWKGFRRIEVTDTSGTRGVMQMFIASSDTPDCSDPATATGWKTLTPPGIDIVRVSFSDNSSAPMDLSSIPDTTVTIRSVGVDILARPLVSTAFPNEQQRQVCDEVRIRADEVTYTPPVTPPTP